MLLKGPSTSLSLLFSSSPSLPSFSSLFVPQIIYILFNALIYSSALLNPVLPLLSSLSSFNTCLTSSYLISLCLSRVAVSQLQNRLAGINPFPAGAQHVNMGIRQGIQQPQMPSQVSHSQIKAATLNTHCCFTTQSYMLFKAVLISMFGLNLCSSLSSVFLFLLSFAAAVVSCFKQKKKT